MQFIYRFNDKFDNELFVFKVNKDNELKKIKKEIKKMEKDKLLTGFCYEKEKKSYILKLRVNISKELLRLILKKMKIIKHFLI